MSVEPSDEPEAAAWREAWRRGLPAAAEPCTGGESLASLAAGELAGEERERVADHLVGCRRCADDYRLLVALHAEAEKNREPAPARRWRWPLAAAAGLLLAAALALFLGRPVGPEGGRPPGDDRLRSAEGAGALSPAAGAVLAGPPAELRWAPQAGASAYRVRLFDGRAELLWEARAGAATSLALPAETAGRLAPGAAYFWVVEIEGPVARRRLGPYWFRLERGG